MSAEDLRCYVSRRSPLLCQQKISDVMSAEDLRCYVSRRSPLLCQQKISDVMSAEDLRCYVSRRSPIFCQRSIFDVMSAEDLRCSVSSSIFDVMSAEHLRCYVSRTSSMLCQQKIFDVLSAFHLRCYVSVTSSMFCFAEAEAEAEAEGGLGLPEDRRWNAPRTTLMSLSAEAVPAKLERAWGSQKIENVRADRFEEMWQSRAGQRPQHQRCSVVTSSTLVLIGGLKQPTWMAGAAGRSNGYIFHVTGSL
jgi:hypothetical protein